MFGLFKAKELKLISSALDQLESRIGPSIAFSEARNAAEKEIKANRQSFINAVAVQKTPPAQIAAVAIANTSGDMLETGQLCMYRGLLSLAGEEMMKVFHDALEQLVRMGAMTQEQMDEQLANVRKSIRTVG